MKKIKITRDKLNLLVEDVYIKKFRPDGKDKYGNDKYVGDVVYHTGNREGGEAEWDMIHTDKMEQNNSDTYIVPLKNGLVSYNITSIDGTQVMHMFKNAKREALFTHNNTDYTLRMDHDSYTDFMNNFINKVNLVIDDYVSKHVELTNDKNIGYQICIYPVKSSSNFNSFVVNRLIVDKQKIHNLPIVKINPNLFNKDISDLQADTDFINKNKDYYDSFRLSPSDIKKFPKELGKYRKETHMHGLETDIRMFQGRERVYQEIKRVNEMADKLLNMYKEYVKARRNYDTDKQKRIAAEIAPAAMEYCLCGNTLEIMKQATFNDVKTGDPIRKSNVSINSDNTWEYTYFKPNEQNKLVTSNILNIADKEMNYKFFSKLKTELAERFKDADKKTINDTVNGIVIGEMEPVDYQIKRIYNDSRMGLKNLYKLNPNELEKAENQLKGNILVIFDDNISGGATLSDICLHFKEMGVQHIIPITFGRMKTQWDGRIKYNPPEREKVHINRPAHGFIYGDGKTFNYKGKVVRMDTITNPMDAANVYKKVFRDYDPDPQRIKDFWMAYQKAKKQNGIS